MEDGLQIIEQIVPWFSPSFNMPIKMVDGMVVDVPVNLIGDGFGVSLSKYSKFFANSYRIISNIINTNSKIII